ncbi:MAG: AAA family ATPase [Candidatus Eremiobacteraeota bacterium]|nr:AAA family ATPase [Candidatus Eremiobacteraeota bacterium]
MLGIEDGVELIGRAAELGAFRSMLKNAANGNGSVLLLSGSSGIGKTALLARFGKLAAPYSDVMDVRFRSAGGTWRPFADRLAAKPLAASLSDVLGYFEGAANQRQQTLLFDDAQFADPSELNVLDALIDMARSFRIVIALSFVSAARELPPPQLAQLVARWRARGAVLRALQPLSEADSALLLRSWQLSSSVVVDASVAAEFVRVSEGNPRYAHEFLAEIRSGEDASALVPCSAAASASAFSASGSPRTVETLTMAAIVGERFSADWICEMLGYHEEDVAAAIQEGIDRCLLRGTLDSQGLYAFRDRAIQKALYVSMAPHRRRQLHERAARLLESRRTDERFDDLIARHWEAAGEFHLATQWLERSAAHCAAKGLLPNAAEFYERAARCAADGQQLALEEQAAQCYESTGSVERALPLRERVVSGLTPTQDAGRFAAACVALIDDYLWAGRRVDALELVKRLQQTKGTAARGPIARSSLCLALGLCRQGLENDARLAFDAVKYRHLPPSDRPRYHLVSAMLQSVIGSTAQTLSAIETAADLAEHVDDVRRSVSTLLQSAMAASLLGHLAAAASIVDRAERRAARGDESGKMIQWARLSRAYYQLLAGDVEGGGRILSSLAGVREGEAWDVNAAAMNVLVGLRTGDAVLVDAFLDLSLLRRLIETRQAGPCATLLMSFPEAMVARGAVRELREVLQHCADSAWGDFDCTVELAIGRFGALELADPARERIRQREKGAYGPVARAAGAFFDAWVAKRRNNQQLAIKAASTAAAAYAGLGWRLHEAVALELSGDFTSAREAYQECGATYDVERLRRKSGRRATLAFFGAPLTLREREVARLVSSGRSDPKIAGELGISKRTVQNHVAAIFSKLGIRARWQMAAAFGANGQTRQAATRLCK